MKQPQAQYSTLEPVNSQPHILKRSNCLGILAQHTTQSTYQLLYIRPDGGEGKKRSQRLQDPLSLSGSSFLWLGEGAPSLT